MTNIQMAPELKNFTAPDETRPFQGHGHADVLKLADRSVLRAVFEPGWKWSVDVQPLAGTAVCETSHLGYCLEGRMRVTMTDGAHIDVSPGDVFAIPPGHDAEVVGDADCVVLDFGEVAAYATKH